MTRGLMHAGFLYSLMIMIITTMLYILTVILKNWIHTYKAGFSEVT